MDRRTIRLVAQSLLAVYTGLALGGYSLHQFIGCRDVSCHNDAPNCRVDRSSSTCACRCHSAPAATIGPAGGTARDGATPTHHSVQRRTGAGHDWANCSLCGLLAQLRVGYAASNPTPVSPESVLIPGPIGVPICGAPPMRLWDVRGPPVDHLAT